MLNKKIKNLDAVFSPKSVAVVGASGTPNKVGNVIMKNFLDGKFPGEIFPVNPKHPELFGLKCYPKISDIKQKIDCVIIATPAETVPQIVDECAAKKVGGIIVLSGGFEEVGRHDLADHIKNVADQHDIPIVGPNCLGIFNPYTRADSVFLPMYKLERPKPGGIAFVSQSGAVGSAVMDLAAFYGMGISKFISYGNSTNMNESDYLEYLGQDKDTDVIILYMEGAKDGRRLLDVMTRVNKIKPIIALKAGKGSGGQAAARSHTGNIAGTYTAYNAAFKQAKVTEAEGINELFEFVKIFDQPKPKGNRVAVITNGGGLGVLTTDAIESEGLVMAQFSEETKKGLAGILPSYGSVANPLDLVADANIEGYEKSIEIMMNDPNIDFLVIIVLMQTPPMDERIVHVLSKATDDLRKPIATISIGGAYTDVYRKIMEGKGIPNYDSPTAAIRAIKKFINYANFLNKEKKK